MSTNNSITQSPSQAQAQGDSLRDALCQEGLYPLDDAGTQPQSDGDPGADLADLAGRLDYADALALMLAADLLMRSPAAGYWQRRQARIDALMTEPLPPPTTKEIESIRGFLASLTQEAS